MIELHTSKWKLKPYAHQLRGVKTLLQRPVYALFWKMRLGKSAAIINAACELFEAGIIDTLLVVAPAQVKDVWLDKTLGEIVTHNWSKAKTYEYKNYGYRPEFNALDLPTGEPAFVVASVEFSRQQGPSNNFPLVESLLASLAGRSVWFVFDEGSVLGNHKTGNTKAMIELRNGEPIKRVTLLDGTPRGNSHMAFYSKFKVMDPAILGCKTFFHYRNRYAKLGGFKMKEVVGEKNMEDFTHRTAPYCEYLEQDTLDMPEKITAVLPVALDEKAWKVYCGMRDELVAELDSGVCAVGHAAVKCVRLAQICAGFLGGVHEEMQMGLDAELCAHTGSVMPGPVTKEIHDAPTEMLMGWLKMRFQERPEFKVVIWSRFVPEIERLAKRCVDAKLLCGLLYGANKSGAGMLHPLVPDTEGFVLIAQPQAAKYGLNLSKADTAVYLSQDYDRVTRSQSEDRIQAPGVRKSSLLADVIVTGPRGQKTIVHDIVASVRAKEDAERRTAQAWKKVLLEE